MDPRYVIAANGASSNNVFTGARARVALDVGSIFNPGGFSVSIGTPADSAANGSPAPPSILQIPPGDYFGAFGRPAWSAVGGDNGVINVTVSTSVTPVIATVTGSPFGNASGSAVVIPAFTIPEDEGVGQIVLNVTFFSGTHTLSPHSYITTVRLR